MEDQQKPTNKTAIQFGIILGIVSVLISVIIYALGMAYDQDWKTGMIGFLAMSIIIFLGIKKYKEFNDGFLTLGEAIKTGITIALIGGIISVVYSYLFMNFIEPDFVLNTMAGAEEKMLERNPNLTDEQIEQALSISKKMMSPGVMSAIGIVWSLFLGLIISLVSGLILKKTED